MVLKDGKVINISYVSSLNFRIAKQILGASDKILKYVINLNENLIYNTLIVSPPGVGKTTVLRDLTRRISNGIEGIGFKGINVGIVDERGEIAATYRGIPQNDIGIRSDVLDGITKSLGMTMLIRSMSPKVIVADEIGSEPDVIAIKNVCCSGVKGIFTAHSASIEELKLNPNINNLILECVFERIIFLSDKKEKCGVEKVYKLNKNEKFYYSMDI